MTWRGEGWHEERGTQGAPQRGEKMPLLCFLWLGPGSRGYPLVLAVTKITHSSTSGLAGLLSEPGKQFMEP